MGMFLERYNSFVVFSTPNLYSMNFLNPFHPMVTMGVTIEFPLFPYIEEPEVPTPDFELKDFYVVGYSLKVFLEMGEDSILFFAYEFYKDMAIKNIQFKYIQDEHNWKHLVALYISHYLSQFIDDLKDEQNLNSLDDRVEKTYKVTEIERMEKNEFYSTGYGIRFYKKYESYGDNILKGTKYKRIIRGY